MGNNICACDKQGSEATATPMSIQRKQETLAERPIMMRDDSRAKLTVLYKAQVEHEAANATPKDNESGEHEEEEHLSL